jgi:hypothetical protein
MTAVVNTLESLEVAWVEEVNALSNAAQVLLSQVCEIGVKYRFSFLLSPP